MSIRTRKNLKPAPRNSRKGGRNRVVIAEAAAVTALGNNLQQLWREILDGKSAIGPVNRFPVGNYPAKIAACIQDLKPPGGRSMIHPLLDRLFAQMGSIPPDADLITATTKAGVDNLEALRRGEPADIQDILPSALPEIVSRKLRLTGNGGINISAACASAAVALAAGSALIATGRTEAVVMCCVDLVTEFTFAGFSALKALSPVACKPFDRRRQGLSLGEGAAGLLLMSAERARRDKRDPLGTVLGWGVANDAAHITAPAKSGRGLIQAVGQALKTSGLKADEITAVNAHGTGTVYNDLMELRAFRRIFGKRRVPVYSVKGAIGHTLGAAGGIEVALGLKTLTAQTVPPTIGLMEPMDEAWELLRSEPVSICGDSLLTTNSGFGGVNAALVLGK